MDQQTPKTSPSGGGSETIGVIAGGVIGLLFLAWLLGEGGTAVIALLVIGAIILAIPHILRSSVAAKYEPKIRELEESRDRHLSEAQRIREEGINNCLKLTYDNLNHELAASYAAELKNSIAEAKNYAELRAKELKEQYEEYQNRYSQLHTDAQSLVAQKAKLQAQIDALKANDVVTRNILPTREFSVPTPDPTLEENNDSNNSDQNPEEDDGPEQFGDQ